jgi:hypothetical protein
MGLKLFLRTWDDNYSMAPSPQDLAFHRVVSVAMNSQAGIESGSDHITALVGRGTYFPTAHIDSHVRIEFILTGRALIATF